ncbi:rod shape-determining protein RodA [Candidatus Parcubacteria bacterium]|nr:rod shape-determining protein RodA [Candidatus Parcubacteria bacterium]
MWFEKFKKIDWFLFFPSLLLTVLGLSVIYSSSFYTFDFLNFKKQAIFLVIGLALMVILSFIDWRILRDNAYILAILYAFSLLALLGLLIFAPNIRGIQSWYKIGLISIGPIEFTKIVLVLLLAKYFSTRHVEVYRIRHILISGLYVAIPTILILLQPEVGSVIILVLLWIGVLLVSGIKIKHFLILCLLGLVLLSLSWQFFLKDYHKARIMSFIAPSLAPLETGWNQAQAIIAIGSGGLIGQGFNNTQTRYGFLPAVQTDFVFSGVAEQFGLAGVIILLACFFLIIWRLVKISLISQSNFPRLFSAGLAIIIIVQASINIAMNLGLLPVIGIPLPLVSYGGSSLLATLAGIGIAQSMEQNL